MTQLDLALCNALADQLGHLALCQVELTDGKPPKWVQLVPSGPKIEALDGREFTNKTPDAIVAAFNDDPLDVPFDWNHSTEIKAEKGEEAPASGWITAMENRGGEIWGRVEWTPRGITSLETRESRYTSPAFLFDKAKNIIKIISAALVNRPAFDMPALAHHTEDTMDPKLLKLLGIAVDATPEQISEAFGKYAETAGKVATELETARAKLTETETRIKGLMADGKTEADKLAKDEADKLAKATADKLAKTEAELAAARAKVPELEQFVPRGDYDVALARVKKLEDDTASDKAVTHAREVETEIAAALKAGKIVPSSKDFYVATCATPDGLRAFKGFVKGAPIVGKDSGLGGKPPPGGGATPPPAKFLRRMGQTAEEFAAGAYVPEDEDDDE